MVRFFILLILVTSCSSQMQDQKINKKNNQDIKQQAEVALQSYMSAHPELRTKLTPEEWEKLRWVSKSMIILRGGRGLSPNEDINHYLAKTKPEIVDEFLDKEQFIHSLIKFNYYFLGINIDEVFSQSSISTEVFSVPSAFSSAINVLNGGDYFELFNPQPKEAIRDLQEAYYYKADGSPVIGDEARELIIKDINNNLEAMDQFLLASTNPVNMENFCIMALKPWPLSSAGLQFHYNFWNTLNSYFVMDCRSSMVGKPPKDKPKKEILEKFGVLKKAINSLVNIVEKYAKNPAGKDLKRLKFIDLKKLLPSYESSYFDGMAFYLQNSSTNYNRSRSAYMLDRFLCDNLVPIDVEVPDQHKNGDHGSDPSCYACHYRLDPMAGFFKNYGMYFKSFKGEKNIMFDDFAQMNKADYDANWLNPVGSARKWNIGVIRSEKDETKNYYGESLEDLFNILKKMPEVKHCMTKRVFEYVTSSGQNVDQEYLNSIAKQFEQISKTNSSQGIKYLFKSFVLSNTFMKRDPELKECYDFPTGFDPKGVPPCQVRFILQNKCSNCHYPFGGEAGLDLTSWEKLEGGRYGFIHEPKGKQISLDESFKRIKESLSSTDPKKRMPLKKHMDPGDREILYLWVDKQLNGE